MKAATLFFNSIFGNEYWFIVQQSNNDCYVYVQKDYPETKQTTITTTFATIEQLKEIADGFGNELIFKDFESKEFDFWIDSFTNYLQNHLTILKP